MLGALLRDTAERCGDRVAVTDTRVSLTWRELLAASERLARRLDDAGIEDTVALVLPDVPTFVVAFFAAAGRGVAAMPLDPRLADAELRAYLDAGGARAILTTAEGADRCRRLVDAPGREIPVLPASEAPPSPERVPPAAPERVPPAAPVDPGTPALVQFSSGSTGAPKRVVRTHAQCAAEAAYFVSTTGLHERDTIFCPVPLFHAHGLGNGLLAAAGSGARLLLFPEARPFVLRRARALELLEAERATFFAGVPMLYRTLAEAPQAADLGALRFAFSAGSPLPERTFIDFQKRFGVRIRQLYGCTEAGSVTVDADPEPAWGSVGRPMRGVTVDVVSDDGEVLPRGEEGAVLVRSPALARGYVDDPEATRRAFRHGGFLMGDRGRIDVEGRLVLTGRARRFIERLGYKVDPAEVEAALAAHPAVREAVVVGVPTGEPGEHAVKAVVVLAAAAADAEVEGSTGAEDPAEALVRHCRERLAPYKVPDRLELRATLPRSPLGKVLLDRLR